MEEQSKVKLRVGLIGLGSAWETRHRPALRALSDLFEVRAIFEQVAHRAEEAAREFNTTAVDGYRALAEREDIDALLMLSGQWFGALPILAACDTGKAFYCAATIDLELQQAKSVKERIEKSGIVFMAAFPHRHAPATLRLKELIATGLGPPRMLFCHQRLPYKFSENHSRASSGNNPSPLRDLVELVDWCRYLVAQEPTSVMGLMHTTEQNSGFEDYKMMSLDFSKSEALGSGVFAQISCGSYIPDVWQEAITFRPPAALQIACRHGVAFIDLPSKLIWFDNAGRHMESLEDERPVGEQLLTQFHRAATGQARNIAGLQDAYRAVATVIAARQSHAEGRRVKLEF